MNQFLKFILEGNSTCFGHFFCPSSGVFHCTHSSVICHTVLLTAHEQNQASSSLILLVCCLKTCMTYNIAVCTVKNSWRWTEELSEICRVSFQNKFEKLVHLVWFTIRNWQVVTLLQYSQKRGTVTLLFYVDAGCEAWEFKLHNTTDSQ